MNTNALHDLQPEVLRIFEKVTRYPVEILDPAASLEDDLGIDSVKLGEIFSVIREQYHLPEKLDIPAEKLRTIAGITGALEQYVAGNGHAAISVTEVVTRETHGLTEAEPQAKAFAAAASASSSSHVAPVNTQVPDSRSLSTAMPAWADKKNRSPDILAQVKETFAKVTRYPLEILDPAASLEDDLGIDSVKLGEIFAVMREQYHLPEKLDIPVEKLKTIAGIAEALEAYLSRRDSEKFTSPVAAEVTPSVGSNGASTYLPGAYREPVARPTSFSAERNLRGSETSFTLNQKPFLGKVTFVSGSGRGLGKEIAVYLAELGSTVVVNSFHSRNRGEQTAEEINSRGGSAFHLWGSMANPEHVQQMFDQIEQRFGTLDFFISNASNGMLAPIESLTVEHWEKAFRTNVVGLHQSAVRAAKLMKKKGGGKIITLSSPAAHGYVEYFGCMGAVKAAVECLTRALAIEFAPYNIQVNCVSPGPIDGELLRKWPDSDRLIPKWINSTPSKRLCEPGDVAHFIAYLLSDPVKAFTGSVMVLDGGISSQGW
jgi:enoyl-[acyl-carrier protein] reductase III